jgi:hypothetical protein
LRPIFWSRIPIALYTRIATNTIRAVMSPLERLNLKLNKNEPPA